MDAKQKYLTESNIELSALLLKIEKSKILSYDESLKIWKLLEERNDLFQGFYRNLGKFTQSEKVLEAELQKIKLKLDEIK